MASNVIVSIGKLFTETETSLGTETSNVDLSTGKLEIKIKSLRLKLIYIYFCQKMINFPYYTRHLDKKGLKRLFRLNLQILHLADLIGL